MTPQVEKGVEKVHDPRWRRHYRHRHHHHGYYYYGPTYYYGPARVSDSISARGNRRKSEKARANRAGFLSYRLAPRQRFIFMRDFAFRLFARREKMFSASMKAENSMAE